MQKLTECVGGEEARSMVQQLVGHVVTQKDKGRQAAAKVTEISMILLKMLIIRNIITIMSAKQ